MTIKLTTLPNGLRVITDTVEAVDSVAMGVWADVGTRHEDLALNGIAHMVEHMIFKGTPSRNAVQIVEAIEDVGGHVNAFTSREITAYHVHLLKDDAPLALDILADIVQNSVMPVDEIERERQVIIQEIGMTADTPDDIVFDHYQETAYPGQALGAPILGRSEIIDRMERKTLLNYVERFYTPSRLVVSAAGNIRHEDFVAQVEKRFSDLPANRDHNTMPARYDGGEHLTDKLLEQSHVVLGFRGIGRLNEDIYAAGALSTIMGGGMASRLFQEIREKRGLVYSVFSFHSAYQDDGQFLVYAGTGPDKLPELMPVICNEIHQIASKMVTDTEIARAKVQMKAGLLMSRESMLTRANQQAKHLIHFNDILDIDARIRRIEAVGPEEVLRVARQVFASTPTLAAMGPLGKLEDYETIKARLAA